MLFSNRFISFICLSFIFLPQPYLIAKTEKNKPTERIGQWIDSENLKPGMQILTADNRILTVQDKWQKQNSDATTYNFTVKNSHTYFVGKEQFWVHNTTDCGKYGKIHREGFAANPSENAANIHHYQDGSENVLAGVNQNGDFTITINLANTPKLTAFKVPGTQLTAHVHPSTLDSSKLIVDLGDSVVDAVSLRKLLTSITNKASSQGYVKMSVYSNSRSPAIKQVAEEYGGRYSWELEIAEIFFIF